MRTWCFNRFTIEMPQECVEDCSHQGPCDEDVRYWVPKLELSHVKPADLIKELKETGGWSIEELQDHDDNLERIVWITACNLKDDDDYGTE